LFLFLATSVALFSQKNVRFAKKYSYYWEDEQLLFLRQSQKVDTTLDFIKAGNFSSDTLPKVIVKKMELTPIVTYQPFVDSLSEKEPRIYSNLNLSQNLTKKQKSKLRRYLYRKEELRISFLEKLWESNERFYKEHLNQNISIDSILSKIEKIYVLSGSMDLTSAKQMIFKNQFVYTYGREIQSLDSAKNECVKELLSSRTMYYETHSAKDNHFFEPISLYLIDSKNNFLGELTLYWSSENFYFRFINENGFEIEGSGCGYENVKKILELISVKRLN
jgi:hypothetical protein